MIDGKEFLSSCGKVTTDHFSFKAGDCKSGGDCSGSCGGVQVSSTMPNAHVSLASAQLYIEQLDFQYIVNKMCSPTYPLQQWTVSEAVHCARLYKNYLFLLKKHLPHFLVPSRTIDEFWHNHILHTKNYVQDCLAIFGHYLHHEPAAVEEDGQRFVEGYLKTKQFYLAEFGVPLDIR